MTLIEGFQELFLRIGGDLSSLEGLLSLGALFLLVVIAYKLKPS